MDGLGSMFGSEGIDKLMLGLLGLSGSPVPMSGSAKVVQFKPLGLEGEVLLKS
jgi:hypothetical protein